MVTKIALILFTLVVYTVAWYGELWSAHPKYEYGAPVGSSVATEASIEKGSGVIYPENFYEESFVNSPEEGTVSHVSTVALLGDGRVMAAWYAGSREGARDVSIYTSVYDPVARLWAPERVVVTRVSASKELGRYVKKLGNPVLFTEPGAGHGANDRLWLVYVTVPIGGWSVSSLNYKVSVDGGESWSDSKKLITGPLFNISTLVKNAPVQLDNGALLLPVYHELMRKFPEILFMTPVETEDGFGLYVRNKRASTTGGVLQGAVLVTEEGGLRAFYRNATGADKSYVLTSTSSDNGLTWTRPENTTIPNPNSGLDVVRGEGGRALIVLNDTFNDRARLALYYSTDSGATWSMARVLEDEALGEFSYPSIVRESRGVYHVTYTYDRKRIKHITFSDEWLISQMLKEKSDG
ncbi:MAG: exo-alpha-sialidase [Proteobacteria bacterium]|nr:exo-alpha-sialidase [Pseudomonadota bacterium]